MTQPTPDQAAVYTAVDKLVADNGAMLTALQAQLAAETAKDQADETSLTAATGSLAAAEGQLTTAQQQLAASQQQVATLTAELAALQPHPAEATRYGYSLYTDWASSDAKYGHKAPRNVARHYYTGLFGALPTILCDGRTISTSYNTSDLPGTLTATIATIKGWDAQVPKGTEIDVDPWHEYDHAEGNAPQTFIAGMGLFTPAVAALKPQLKNIVLRSKAMATAYLFSGLSAHKPSDFALTGPAVPDVFSIDMDGRNSLTAYHDFTPEVTAAVAFAKAAGYKEFAIDELGCERTTADTTGQLRAAWYRDQVAMVVKLVAAAGMTLRYVNLWEYVGISSYYVPPGSPEAAQWSSLVAVA